MNSDDDHVFRRAQNILTRRINETRASDTAGHLNRLPLAVDLCQFWLGTELSEHFGVIFLDAKGRILNKQVFGQGSIVGTSVPPRNIVRAALQTNAASAILTHNHPSGDCTPSEHDKKLTVQLYDALGLIDVRVLDHLIVSGENYFSFAQNKVPPIGIANTKKVDHTG